MTLREYVRAAFGIVTPAARRGLGIAVFGLAALSVLDLLALMLVVALTTLGTETVASDGGESVARLPTWQRGPLEWIGISTQETAAAVLGALVVVLFVGKALLASTVLHRFLRSLARHEAAVTHGLMAKLMRAPLIFHLRQRNAQMIIDTTFGVEALVMKTIGPTVLIASELVLMATLFVGLLVFAPAVAIGSIVYFSAVLLILHSWIGRRAEAAGKVDAEATTSGMTTIQLALGGYREVVTRGVADYFVDDLGSIRSRGARSRSEVAYLGLLPRYFLESALVVGMAFAFAVQLPFTGFSGALSGLALFAVAGFRLLPSLQRVQSSVSTIKAVQSFGERTLGLIRDVDESLAATPHREAAGGLVPTTTSHLRQPASGPVALEYGLTCDKVSFTYPGASVPALVDVSTEFRAGEMAALVGASGSGKSTLVDILLGLLTSSAGCVLVDGVPLSDVLPAWRQMVGYVPQDSYLMPRSIRANVALGVRREEVNDEAVWAALRRASLEEVVRGLPGQLDFHLGDSGSGVSGGQRQRLGIARALYHDPLVLILDEATSALDVETEAQITSTLAQLSGLTKIVVAHRLSTVRDADRVLFLRRGRLEATGPFDEVRRAVPDFARQVHLSGITPEPLTGPEPVEDKQDLRP